VSQVNAAVFALQVLFGGVAWLGVGSAKQQQVADVEVQQIQGSFSLSLCTSERWILEDCLDRNVDFFQACPHSDSDPKPT